MPCNFKFTNTHSPTRTATFSSPPRWSVLAEKLANLYSIPASSVGVTYRDSEGDEVTLNSEEELADFYLTSLPKGQTILFNVVELGQEPASTESRARSVTLDDDGVKFNEEDLMEMDEGIEKLDIESESSDDESESAAGDAPPEGTTRSGSAVTTVVYEVMADGARRMAEDDAAPRTRDTDNDPRALWAEMMFGRHAHGMFCRGRGGHGRGGGRGRGGYHVHQSMHLLHRMRPNEPFQQPPAPPAFGMPHGGPAPFWRPPFGPDQHAPFPPHAPFNEFHGPGHVLPDMPPHHHAHGFPFGPGPREGFDTRGRGRGMHGRGGAHHHRFHPFFRGFDGDATHGGPTRPGPGARHHHGHHHRGRGGFTPPCARFEISSPHPHLSMPPLCS